MTTARREAGNHAVGAASLASGAPQTNCSRLRALLLDGAWHSMRELQEVAGWRYGGRLHELKHGKDGGPPVDHETRREKSGEVFYRVTR